MTKYTTPSKTINALFLLVAIACIAYYIALGVTVRFGQSLDFMWLVFAAVAFATLIGVVAGYSPANRAMKLSALESLKNE